MNVEVYKNLHKKLWSIRHNGRVIDHRDKVILKDARFMVQQGGRDRVLRDKRKNVHAFIKGELIHISQYRDEIEYPNIPTEGEFITYNPYKWGFFYKINNEDPVVRADYVDLDINSPKQCEVLGIWMQRPVGTGI